MLPLWVIVTTPLMARAGAQIDWLNVRISRLGQDEFFRVRSGGWIGYLRLWSASASGRSIGQPIDHNKAIYPGERDSANCCGCGNRAKWF